VAYGSSGTCVDDKLNRLTSLKDGSTTLVSYTHLGEAAVVRADYHQPNTRLDLWGGTPGSYTGLDRFGRTIDHTWRNYANATNLVQLKHGYDRNANRLYRRDEIARSSSAGLDQLYTYDGLDRLIDMERGTLNSANDAISNKSHAQQWDLDAVGNWTSFDRDDDGDGTFELSQSRSHNLDNEITSVTESAGTAWPTPSYSAVGNTVSFPQPANPGSRYSATYDAWNRLVKLSDAGTTVAEYEFDAANRRIIEKPYTNGSLDETRHVYFTDAWQRVEERVDGTSASDTSGASGSSTSWCAGIGIQLPGAATASPTSASSPSRTRTSTWSPSSTRRATSPSATRISPTACARSSTATSRADRARATTGESATRACATTRPPSSKTATEPSTPPSADSSNAIRLDMWMG